MPGLIGVPPLTGHVSLIGLPWTAQTKPAAANRAAPAPRIFMIFSRLTDFIPNGGRPPKVSAKEMRPIGGSDNAAEKAKGPGPSRDRALFRFLFLSLV